MTNKYINFIPIRHGLTCSNLIYWGIGEEVNRKMTKDIQNKINEYAPDTDLCRIGIEQCLQLSDFLQKRKEDGYDYIFGNAMYVNPVNKYDNKPITVLTCSELRRSQENIYISLIKYLPDFLKNGGKIMILPWLNEKIELNENGKIDDIDNVPETYEERKKSWKKFIGSLRNFFRKDMGDMGNEKKKYKIMFEDDWDKIFYFNPYIYQPFLKNRKLEPFSDEGKLFKIPLMRLIPGTIKMIPDINNFMDNLGNILEGIDGESINFIMISHIDFLTRFIKKIYPKSRESLRKQGVVNCELIKLPRYDLNGGKFLEDKRNFIEYRIFPVGFHNLIINRPSHIPYSTGKEKIHNYFIFYGSKLDLFFSLYNLIGITTFKVGEDYFKNDKKKFDAKRKVEIKKPLKKYFNMKYVNYGREIEKGGDYYRILEGMIKFYGKKNRYFYNYPVLMRKLREGNLEDIGKDKILRYFFGMCDSDLIKIIPSLVNLKIF